MTLKEVRDLDTPIGEILQAAGAEGLLLESASQIRYAVLPVDEELIDFLIERNPSFIEACQRIRERMRAGRYRTHEEVKRMLAGD